MMADIDVVLTRIKQTAVVNTVDCVHSCKDSSILIVPSLKPVESLGRSALRHHGMDVKTTVMRLDELFNLSDCINDDAIIWICGVVITHGNDASAVRCLAADILRRSCDSKLLEPQTEGKKWKVVSTCFMKKEKSAREKALERDAAREEENEIRRAVEQRVVDHSQLIHTTRMISTIRDISDRAGESKELLLTFWYLIQALSPSMVLKTERSPEDTRLKVSVTSTTPNDQISESKETNESLSILKRYRMLMARKQLEEQNNSNDISTAELETTHHFRLHAVETSLRLASDVIKQQSKVELHSEAVLTINCVIRGLLSTKSVDDKENYNYFKETVVRCILENNTISALIGLLQKRQLSLLRRVLSTLEPLSELDEKLAITLMDEARATLPLIGALHAVRTLPDLVATVWRIISIISRPAACSPADLKKHSVIQICTVIASGQLKLRIFNEENALSVINALAVTTRKTDGYRWMIFISLGTLCNILTATSTRTSIKMTIAVCSLLDEALRKAAAEQPDIVEKFEKYHLKSVISTFGFWVWNSKVMKEVSSLYSTLAKYSQLFRSLLLNDEEALLTYFNMFLTSTENCEELLCNLTDCSCSLCLSRRDIIFDKVLPTVTYIGLSQLSKKTKKVNQLCNSIIELTLCCCQSEADRQSVQSIGGLNLIITRSFLSDNYLLTLRSLLAFASSSNPLFKRALLKAGVVTLLAKIQKTCSANEHSLLSSLLQHLLVYQPAEDAIAQIPELQAALY